MKLIGILGLLIVLGLTGQAQEKYIMVFLNNRPEKKSLPEHQVDSLQAGHMANIQRMAREGKLLAAGPFEGGGGIFILNTTSVGEAEQWLQTDPAISAGRFNIELLPWSPRSGSVCLVADTTEMVHYTFIRYTSNITKFNVRQAPQLFRAHDVYIKNVVKTGNVISEGIFDNNDGSTMVMKGNVEHQVFMADPAVKNGILQPEIKTLWIGKGAFCEE